MLLKADFSGESGGGLGFRRISREPVGGFQKFQNERRAVFFAVEKAFYHFAGRSKARRVIAFFGGSLVPPVAVVAAGSLLCRCCCSWDIGAQTDSGRGLGQALAMKLLSPFAKWIN